MAKTLCVYAASSRHLPERYYSAVRAIGAAAGRSDWGLVFGGANIGLMNAFALGVKETGGYVTSVIPRLFDKRGLTFEASDEVLLTDDLRARKKIMESRADAFLVLPGGPGTLDEFFEVLTLKQLGLLVRPIVLFNLEGHFEGTLLQLKTIVERGFADAVLLDQIVVESTPEGVLRALGLT